jgi:hypothetical protein
LQAHHRSRRSFDGSGRGTESPLPNLQYEHKYRHNQTGRKELTKEGAFQKVLASVTGQLGGSSTEPAKKKRTK